MSLRFVEPGPEVYRYPLTIRHLLDAVMSSASSREIVYRDRYRYSYRDFARRVGSLASLLRDAGAGQGVTVAVMDWDSHRYLEAYFAVPMMGAVLQTVNVRLPAPQIAYTLRHARAEILLVHRDFFSVIDALLPELPLVKAVIAIADGEEEDLPVWARGEYEALSAAASPEYSFEDFDENAIATTFYTTGTTGDPKGVCFTHRQLVLHTLAATAHLATSEAETRLGADDVYMPLTPMFHVHAWGLPYVATMLGVKQVYPGRYEPELLCRLRRDHDITYSHCVPTILQMLIEAAEKTATDLTGWKMIIGGSALSEALFSTARRRGLSVFVGYGMSETAPIVSVTRAGRDVQSDGTRSADRLMAAGIPIPLVSARVVGEDMGDLPHDGQHPGELVLRAPWLTPLYLDDEAASQDLWRGGWLHTQDVATIDKDGTVRIRDRLKDVIKSGGEWIDSIQLEQIVATADGVAEAAIVAVPDVKWGERPLAVIVPKLGRRPSLNEINIPVRQAIMDKAITSYAKLELMEIVEALPRTSVGKIDKKLLRARFG